MYYRHLEKRVVITRTPEVFAKINLVRFAPETEMVAGFWGHSGQAGRE